MGRKKNKLLIESEKYQPVIGEAETLLGWWDGGHRWLLYLGGLGRYLS